MNLLVQTLRPAYYADVEKQLRRIFYEILFAPLLVVIEKANSQPAEIRNAPEEDLVKAIKSGRIQYAKGIFSGEFSAAISKALRRLGALFDSRLRVYRLDQSRVPGWVVAEASTYQARATQTHGELLRELDRMQGNLAELLKSKQVNASKSIEAIDAGFAHAAVQLSIQPKLSEQGKQELKREYSTNMNLWIEKFSKEEIIALRERVELNATQGYRFDRLITSIKNRYSVSESKASFLARQETSLFLAKFRQKRFADAGIRRYRWSTAHDARVRDAHKALQGKVFAYDSPPLIDQGDGRGARPLNPGQDYNCRCVDIPVFEGQES